MLLLLSVCPSSSECSANQYERVFPLVYQSTIYVHTRVSMSSLLPIHTTSPSMAPPPTSTSTFRPSRAAHRYRKGQAPAGYRDNEEGTDSDDEAHSGNDDEEEEKLVGKGKQQQQQQRRDGLQVINQGTSGLQQQKTLKVVSVKGEIGLPAVKQGE